MKKEALTVIAVVALTVMFLISGCVQEKTQQPLQAESEAQVYESEDKQIQPSSDGQTLKDEEEDISKLGLGKLCPSLAECFVFCKSNVGRCTDFCVKNPSHRLCKQLPAAKSQPWVPDAITQPLPEGASKIRLVLPAPIDKIDLTTIGAYGAHPGGHAEGLDHEWISIEEGVPVGSWADGEVVYARPNNHPQDKEYRIIIYYGDGLWGEHMHVATPLVKEGDRVKAGDPVAYGEVFEPYPSYHSGEFNVADQHRRDGVGYWYKFVKEATLVSPFDYLRDDVKQQLVEKWQKEVIDAYLLQNKNANIPATPWEPYLTNPILFHQEHKGTLIGEWFLRSKPWAFDDVPDILIFFTNDTQYYDKQKVSGVDDDREKDITKSTLSGDWDADYQNNRLIITTHDATYFGIFELDESAPQAKLKIEYQTGAYPAGFSELAAVYTERERISKGEETHYWKYPEDDPRNW